MKTKLLSTLLFVALFHIAFAQEFNKAKLDDYFDTLEVNDRFMGSVAVSQDGQLIYARAIGFANLESGTKANTDSKYRIGSISKTFTTVLVQKAVEAGKLKLDESIESYFPAIPNADKITIRLLLGHRSGIHNFTNDKSYLDWNTEAKSESEMVEIIAKGGSDFEPGTKTEYSNSNFVLLSYILEKVEKKSYATLLHESIVRPLELTNTYFGGKINADKNECYSYKYIDDVWKMEEETDLSIPMGAGSIVSTPSDLAKFSDALFSGKLVSAESLEQMETIVDGLGFGLFQFPFYDRKGYGHTGGIDGFRSVFMYFPDGKVSFALTSNGSRMNNNDISVAVLSAAYDKPFEIPVFMNSELSPEELEKYVGTYASAQLPLKITISIKDGKLIGQGTGQAPFPLELTGKDKFEFPQAGLVMEFKPDEKTMLLKQGGGVFNFTKESE
ncbi:serine hydrolase domain-containing protein [Mangrovibacterium diazotrophicum]|uniref:CubicO group peptidase (Beta-lactamase class C family) n=1 Tax=Mangrovibacterium diazotrophicum TaxID=1261403 RepID=A0A419WBK9_9BACT|nr:serine hydrolase domain-containing protein [Mangrovibacterium diazotrophicum]RKD92860.1 CubicO group peptidase (beta-lactamase class C family) [Mangrovibacterium diazotrophicum]